MSTAAGFMRLTDVEGVNMTSSKTDPLGVDCDTCPLVLLPVALGPRSLGSLPIRGLRFCRLREMWEEHCSRRRMHRRLSLWVIPNRVLVEIRFHGDEACIWTSAHQLTVRWRFPTSGPKWDWAYQWNLGISVEPCGTMWNRLELGRPFSHHGGICQNSMVLSGKHIKEGQLQGCTSVARVFIMLILKVLSVMTYDHEKHLQQN